MWLIYALLSSFLWAAADLFYKKGAVSDDKTSHIKTVIMVGLVMGIYAFGYMTVKGIRFSPVNLIIYLPVSLMYILSMTVGYIGLRYIELSVSAPVQNSSGMITAILLFIFFRHPLEPLKCAAVFFITAGLISLGVIEKRILDKTLILDEYEKKKYRCGFTAFMFPVLYSIIDGLGTFADAIYLDELSLISEDNALLSYEFTFFICAVIGWIYLKIKNEKFDILQEKDRGMAAVFETAGQFFYVFAMSRNAIIAAPLIASYSALSVLLSRIFLKEKLAKKQYAAISAVIAGIVMLAVAET